MKITFTKDHQSQLSGNSFYTAGTTADLSRGDELIALGVAYEGWGRAPVVTVVPVAPVEIPPMPDPAPTKAATRQPRRKG